MKRKAAKTPSEAVLEVISSHPLTIAAIRGALQGKGDQVYRYNVIANPGVHSPSDSSSVVVVDSCALPVDFRHLLKTTRLKYPQSKLIVLLRDDGECEAKMLSLLYMGIDNFVLLNEGWAQELPHAVESATNGVPCVPMPVLKKYIQEIPQLFEDKNKSDALLTRREHEILSLLFRDCSNKEIANALHISMSTVKYHVSHILRKLKVQSRRYLTRDPGGRAQLSEPQMKIGHLLKIEDVKKTIASFSLALDVARG
jgi:DNA-binding NarL/FixJ family response regulator